MAHLTRQFLTFSSSWEEQSFIEKEMLCGAPHFIPSIVINVFDTALTSLVESLIAFAFESLWWKFVFSPLDAAKSDTCVRHHSHVEHVGSSFMSQLWDSA